MNENQQSIINAMKKVGKPMRPGEIAEAAALDKDVVSKEIKELKDQGLVDSPKRCFYGLVE